MDDRRDGENVIHIVGGDEADNRDDKPVASTWYNFGEGSGGAAASSMLSYGWDRTMLSEAFQIPTFGSSTAGVVEDDRSLKAKQCKNYHTEAGCPFGDTCIYIHDEEAKARESLAIRLGPRSRGRYQDGAATGIGGGLAAHPPLAPIPPRKVAVAETPKASLPLARMPPALTVSSGTVRPLNWRSRICHRWEQSGYCQFGSKCYFAHGEAELQRYGGGLGERVANPNNQRVMVPKLPAASGSSVAHAVPASGSSAAHAVPASVVPGSAVDAAGSGQLSGATSRPIPRWKVPKKLVGIYADWIDDIE